MPWDSSPAGIKKEYNALTDPNMRHYFENRSVQKHLYNTGQIDRAGRVIDLERNKSKFHIIEQEFKAGSGVATFPRRASRTAFASSHVGRNR